ncbi:LuxR family transcriptional regulator [Sphingomonas sp. ASV193]|uniref:LuxR family transcriptional regulator n=1 Tax=Sphingomonas sp. ASV193 TaxID=3144405 RepID=UPI0032E86108
MFERVQAFVDDAGRVETEAALSDLIGQVCADLHFDYFALTHHVDPRRGPRPTIRLANYPAEWVDYFDRHRLGPVDPIHRASHLTSVGFVWSQVPAMIALTKRDVDILEGAARSGLGDGFTIPAHVPGETLGSCSFATQRGRSLDGEVLPAAQLVGLFAFEAARRLYRVRSSDVAVPALTDRQRDCVVWAARGKSDWEISRILGISHETVIAHVKQARERYGVAKRTLLAIHALLDGTISFLDVMNR